MLCVTEEAKPLESQRSQPLSLPVPPEVDLSASLTSSLSCLLACIVVKHMLTICGTLLMAYYISCSNTTYGIAHAPHLVLVVDVGTSFQKPHNNMEVSHLSSPPQWRGADILRRCKQIQLSEKCPYY